MEILVENLAEIVQNPVSSPMEKEVVVVQSIGMERWISLELARLTGICANIEFCLPRKIVTDIFKKIVTHYPDYPPFDPQVLTWEIMKFLPSCQDKDGFDSLNNYLTEASTLKYFQLSAFIADVFDQYTIYRPEMVLEWEKGKDTHWQALLWRELTEGKEPFHNATLRNIFLKRADDFAKDFSHFPERISVFGISALPPYYLDILTAVSKWTDINFFILNPCREYWADIVSNREERKFKQMDRNENLPSETLHLTQGNSLLASLGSYGRDFHAMLQSFDMEEFDSFIEPKENTMLSRIQTDIFHLREPEEESGKKIILSERDDSIQIHSCHSPLRETEILHDHILAMLEADPCLTPGDIIVMTPDIENYSSCIHAVFGSKLEKSYSIPFSISDRNLRKESNTVDTFLAILELPSGRFGVNQVLDILESLPLRRKFGFSDLDMQHVKRWVERSYIRWGIDKEHRKEMGSPEFSENTWKTGLERLLLGYAMVGQDKTFKGILPYDDMEGGEVETLGNLSEFLAKLVCHVDSLKKKRTLKQWEENLENLVNSFFIENEESEKDFRFIQKALYDLSKSQEISGFDGEIDLATIKAYIEIRCKKEISGFGFITGKVTFCAMLPMRSVPFKVICLMGMNGDAFPRKSTSQGFNLITKKPRKGDRSIGKEDRYIFLETIISAREILYISFVGQSIMDNSPSPPSVLVTELLDYIEHGFELPSGGPIHSHMIRKHRLQPFNPEYFKGAGPLFSYSKENFEAGLKLRSKHNEGVPFISHGITKPTETWKTLDIRLLCGFFNNPSKFLLNKRLGIYLEEESPVISEKEPFSLQGLERYMVSHELVEKKLHGLNIDNHFSLIKAAGILPHGTVGKREFEKIKKRIRDFVPLVQFYIQGQPLKFLALDKEISDFRIMGLLNNISDFGLLNYRCAKIKSGDRLKAWVQHLIFNIAAPDNIQKNSVFISEDAILKFFPLKNSVDLLGPILQLYWEGLSMPLKFFPRSSWVYAEALLQKGKTEVEALEKSKNEWSENEFGPSPEEEDPYFDLCFRNIDPLDSEFRKLAVEVFRPILQFGEEERI